MKVKVTKVSQDNKLKRDRETSSIDDIFPDNQWKRTRLDDQKKFSINIIKKDEKEEKQDAKPDLGDIFDDMDDQHDATYHHDILKPLQNCFLCHLYPDEKDKHVKKENVPDLNTDFADTQMNMGHISESMFSFTEKTALEEMVEMNLMQGSHQEITTTNEPDNDAKMEEPVIALNDIAMEELKKRVGHEDMEPIPNILDSLQVRLVIDSLTIITGLTCSQIICYSFYLGYTRELRTSHCINVQL
jgi:hypothetical protein